MNLAYAVASFIVPTHIGDSSACDALTLAIAGPNASVFGGELMASDAVSLVAHPFPLIAAPDVFEMRHEFEVVRPDAGMLATEVVPFVPDWRPSHEEVMCMPRRTIESEVSVSTLGRSHPEPTGLSLVDLQPESGDMLIGRVFTGHTDIVPAMEVEAIG